MLRPRLAPLALLPLSLATFAACGAPPAPAPSGEAPASAGEPIINGTSSDASQDAVVLLLNNVDLGGYECTGTLLAPNLVLTARHCVSQLGSDSGFACDQNGNVIGSGGTVGADFNAKHLYVQTGATRPADPNAAQAHGAKIFHDGGAVLCNHDLALVLLDTKIPNAKIAPVRLDDVAAPGEQFTAIGWGVVSDQNPVPGVRQQRTGLKVVDVGPATDTNLQVEVSPNEFVTGEASCEGDSGGPAVDARTGAVIGVVSRGGNGTAPNANASNVAETCSGAGTVNFYTQVSPFKSIVLEAYSAAGQDPWIEGGPNPLLAKFGGGCSADADCQSGICINLPNGQGAQCSQSCDTSNPCPSGYACKSDGTQNVCAVQPGSGSQASGSSGCSAAPVSGGGGGEGAAWLFVSLAAIAGAMLRRRA